MLPISPSSSRFLNKCLYIFGGPKMDCSVDSFTVYTQARRRGGSRGSNEPPLGCQPWQKVRSNVRLMMMWTGQNKSEQQKNMDGWPTVYRSMYSQCNWVSKIRRPNYEYPKKPDSAREHARLCFVTIVCWLPRPPYWIMHAQFSGCTHDSLI